MPRSDSWARFPKTYRLQIDCRGGSEIWGGLSAFLLARRQRRSSLVRRQYRQNHKLGLLGRNNRLSFPNSRWPSVLMNWRIPVAGRLYGKGHVPALSLPQRGLALKRGISNERVCETKRVNDSVTDIAFSAGADLLACTSGYQLEVWDSREDRAILQIGDSSRVNAVAFAPGGQTVAIGIWEAVKLYDLTSCRLNAELNRKTSSHVRVVGFSPAGDILVCGESTIQIWRLPQNEFVRNLQPGHQVAGLAFCPHNEQLITAGNNLLLWDLRTGDLLAKVDDSGPTWDAAQFTTDGTKLVASGGIYANDLHFGVWDVLTGKADVKYSVRFPDWVMKTALSPDGRLCAGACEDGSVRVFDVRTGRSVLDLKPHSAGVLAAAFSRNGFLATGGKDNQLRFVNLKVAANWVDAAADDRGAASPSVGSLPTDRTSKAIPEPVQSTVGASDQPLFVPRKADPDVRFIRKYTETGKLGHTNTYEIYTAETSAAARDFLLSKKIENSFTISRSRLPRGIGGSISMASITRG